MYPPMYPPTLPAISAAPRSHIFAPNERSGGAGGTATMSFWPSSTVVTAFEPAAGCLDALHGGSGLNSVLGNDNGGGYIAGPCSDGPPSDLSSDGPPLSGTRAAAHMHSPSRWLAAVLADRASRGFRART